MGFDRKLKINLYHEHFPEASETYTRFPKFTLLFSICERLHAAKFAAAFYEVSFQQHVRFTRFSKS